MTCDIKGSGACSATTSVSVFYFFDARFPGKIQSYFRLFSGEIPDEQEVVKNSRSGFLRGWIKHIPHESDRTRNLDMIKSTPSGGLKKHVHLALAVVLAAYYQCKRQSIMAG